MMLSDRDILREMMKGRIYIDPFDMRHLGPNSYDVRLGSTFYFPNPSVKVFDPFTEESVIEYWGKPVVVRETHVRIPAMITILAHTKEAIGGRHNIVPRMHARSSMARSGISVCKCAGMGDVGYMKRWTMEITNHTNAEVWIPISARVAQITFEYVKSRPTEEYHGKYRRLDSDPREWMPSDMLPRLYRDWDWKGVADIISPSEHTPLPDLYDFYSNSKGRT
jgi:dCTP deaminase